MVKTHLVALILKYYKIIFYKKKSGQIIHSGIGQIIHEMQAILPYIKSRSKIIILCDEIKRPILLSNLIVKDIKNVRTDQLNYNNFQNCVVICLSTEQEAFRYESIFKHFYVNNKIPIIAAKIKNSQNNNKFVHRTLSFPDSGTTKLVSKLYFTLIMYFIKRKRV